MTKQHFIALADMIRAYNSTDFRDGDFTQSQIEALASFCGQQNSRFDRQRWLDYVNGQCGPNGGKR